MTAAAQCRLPGMPRQRLLDDAGRQRHSPHTRPDRPRLLSGAGAGPAMQDLIAGRIDYMCDLPSTSLPQIEANLSKRLPPLDNGEAPPCQRCRQLRSKVSTSKYTRGRGCSSRRGRRNRSSAVSLRLSAKHWILARCGTVSKPSVRALFHPSGEAPNILPSSLSRKSRNGLPQLGKVG